MRTLWKSVVAVVVFFAIAELALRVGYFVRNSTVSEIPLPYMIGDEYGPSPPWLDSLRILQPDDRLIWRSRSNLRRRYLDMFTPASSEEARVSLLRRFLPGVPAPFRANPVWNVSLNSEGFRDAELPKSKSPATFRIVCLGDSWTFGANVDDERTYPRQLRAALAREFPGARFEVLNLGVMGYSSFQGLELWKQRAADLAPDVVLIGYAMNDGRIAGFRDKDMAAATPRPSAGSRFANVLDHLESYKLLRYAALTLKDKPKSVREHIQETVTAAGGRDPAVYQKFEAWTRVSPSDYERNLTTLIDLIESRGAAVILLYNELDNDSPYRAALQKIAAARSLPLVDTSELIARARRRHQADLEERLHLRSPATRGTRPDGTVDVVFRVHLGDRAVPDAIYITGAHSALGNLAPNTVRMYDDGTHGDQRAGDSVWSYTAALAPGTRLFFVYTNSGTQGKWEGLDVPVIRRVTVEAARTTGVLHAPIDTFGAVYLQADAWHTNAAGYGLLAQTIIDALKQSDNLTRYLSGVSAVSGR